ncbi:hypothetical protein E4U61_006676 [Claviceps capensis]|nr:hypothetical protein E4U61_006676 [Claviceps capensis]
MELEASCATRGYSAADAIQDIVHLRDKGVDMTSRNEFGKTPLEILLNSDSGKDGKMQLAAFLEGRVEKVLELAGLRVHCVFGS